MQKKKNSRLKCRSSNQMRSPAPHLEKMVLAENSCLTILGKMLAIGELDGRLHVNS